MKVGIMQPYFMPYIGYFQLMKAVDIFVVYNDVNYIKRGWVARNNILIGGKKQLINICLQGASQNKHFTDIRIIDDFSKLTKTLDFNYSKARYFPSVMELMNVIFSYPEKRLDLFLTHSFKQILSYLNIDTKIILSSDIEKDNSLKGTDKVLAICKKLDADTYYNAIGGRELYDREIFQRHNIVLSFVQTDQELSYKQFDNMPFIPNLSIIDVLMFNSPYETNHLLDQYELV
ncbi:WbqC family protein [uncultured Parabacteroides sp.]|uniref:WbqC family protein n=1 Tax=uncultured Parabacteroides sp. TaxID=512312 RepID=UPI0026055EE9|nr:WbqC family protein [uncultured Parabacteroides sp.]